MITKSFNKLATIDKWEMSMLIVYMQDIGKFVTGGILLDVLTQIWYLCK